jgi:hypothetical protein
MEEGMKFRDIKVPPDTSCDKIKSALVPAVKNCLHSGQCYIIMSAVLSEVDKI